MTHLTITDEDRGPTGRIMTAAERRAAERNPAPPAAQGDMPRRTVRARRPEDRLDGATPATAPQRIGRKGIGGAVCGVLLVVALIAASNYFAPARPVQEMTVTILPGAGQRPPTAAPAPTPARQDAYAAPAGALLGSIPLTVTLSYRDSRAPHWAGVAWDGGIVWVRTSAALTTLPDLAEPTPAPAPPAWAPPVIAPPAEIAPTRDSTHQRPHDESGPYGAATVQALPAQGKASAPACWPGVPVPNPDDAPRCWDGVPYALPED